MSRSKHFYPLCAFLVLIFMYVLTESYSYTFGNRPEAVQILFKPIDYLLNGLDVKIEYKENVSFENQEISKLIFKDSKQKQESFNGSDIKRGELEKVRTADNSKSDSSNCSKRDVTLFKNEQPMTGLVSFPGSGNTWLRHLIQQMTGIGTSSLTCDEGLEKRGFPYECETQKEQTILVKTHDARFVHMFKKLVLLVRNPYDAFLSHANLALAGHTGHPSKQDLTKVSAWMFDNSLTWYVNLTRNTIGKFKGPVHVVQYEKLKTDLAKELRSLAMFLNVNVTKSDIDCTVKSQEGNFHRHTSDSKHIELLRTVYNKEKRLRLQEAVRTCEKLIKDAYNIDIDLGGSIGKI